MLLLLVVFSCLLCVFGGDVACVRACVCCRVCVLLASLVFVVVCV